jgi:hypothetical protein
MIGNKDLEMKGSVSEEQALVPITSPQEKVETSQNLESYVSPSRPTFDITNFLVSDKDSSWEYSSEREIEVAEEVEAICSRGRELKEKLREKELQFAVLRKTYKILESSTVDFRSNTQVGDSARWKELLSEKKKKVVRNRRKFLNMELQLKTLNAILTATTRFEALPVHLSRP